MEAVEESKNKAEKQILQEQIFSMRVECARSVDKLSIVADSIATYIENLGIDKKESASLLFGLQCIIEDTIACLRKY